MTRFTLLQRLQALAKFNLVQPPYVCLSFEILRDDVLNGETPLELADRYIVVQTITYRGEPDESYADGCETREEAAAVLENFLFDSCLPDYAHEAKVYDLDEAKIVEYDASSKIKFK